MCVVLGGQPSAAPDDAANRPKLPSHRITNPSVDERVTHEAAARRAQVSGRLATVWSVSRDGSTIHWSRPSYAGCG
jgi:hypothetical protein